MTSKENKKLPPLLQSVGKEIKETVTGKRIGCFVGLAAWLLTVVQTIAYGGIPSDIFSGAVVAFSVAGIVLFPLLSLFRQTSGLAPVALMICDFMCLASFIGAEGIVDYFSTQFFDGFTVAKIFRLPFSVWFSVLSFALSFLIASVATYLPQNKKPAVEMPDEPAGEIATCETDGQSTQGEA